MYQGETNENIEITEYHLCRECKSKLVLPDGFKDKFELICLKNSPLVNKSGGLSKCQEFEGD